MKYLIEYMPGLKVVGTLEQTRGNDEDFPTFRLEDGRLVSVTKERVLEEIDESNLDNRRQRLSTTNDRTVDL